MNSRKARCWTTDITQRHRRVPLRLAVIIGIVLIGSTAQTLAQGESPKNRFSLSSRVGFNITADFKNLGGFPAQTNPGPATNGVDHFYDDGFNRVDLNGSASTNTFFWGYQNAAQVPGNDTIVMNSSSSAATRAIKDVGDDPQWGAELSYIRQLGDNGVYRWGIETAVGWADLTFGKNGTTTASVTRTSDAYALNGTTPPPAPYAGTLSGPGPQIGTSPTRTVSTIPNGAVTSGQYALEAQAYTLRLGLHYETPFNDRLMLQFGGGFAGAFLDSEFSFAEETVLSGVGSVTRSATGSEDDFVIGVYAGAGLTFHVTERLTAFAAAQYQHLQDFTQQLAGKEAEIRFDQSIFVTVGVGFSF